MSIVVGIAPFEKWNVVVTDNSSIDIFVAVNFWHSLEISIENHSFWRNHKITWLKAVLSVSKDKSSNLSPEAPPKASSPTVFIFDFECLSFLFVYRLVQSRFYLYHPVKHKNDDIVIKAQKSLGSNYSFQCNIRSTVRKISSMNSISSDGYHIVC